MEPQTTQKPKTSAKDFFVYLSVMALLYASVASLITLLFQYIDFSFPDALDYAYVNDPYGGATRWAIAALMILFPAFIIGTWYANKERRLFPEKENLSVRKWLTALALFIAGAAILVDLSTLVYFFLGGEITTRFILKVLVILLVAAFVFYYYILDLRGVIREKITIARAFGGGAILIVLVSIVSGFFIIGSPQSQRDLRLDNQRISDLQMIQSQIVYTHWQQKGELPEKLSDLEEGIIGFSVPSDPETGKEYAYKKLSSTNFELCATFKKESYAYGKAETGETKPSVSYDPYYGENWIHPKGEFCFEREIDPQLFPIKGVSR